MLQQTQVERVIKFYERFLKQFPTAKNLAKAPLGSVLKAWQGLGYNRRAKMLHESAKMLVRARFNLAQDLEKCPGVGPYTAQAVAAFAYNRDVIFVETNIRTAITHHFFSKNSTTIYGNKVTDEEITTILTRLLPKGRAREWYAALMDYGSYLKRSGIRLNGQHVAYVKQKTFKGSAREARGAILRRLAKESCQGVTLTSLLGKGRRAQMRGALKTLLAEGLIQKSGRVFTLPR